MYLVDNYGSQGAAAVGAPSGRACSSVVEHLTGNQKVVWVRFPLRVVPLFLCLRLFVFKFV